MHRRDLSKEMKSNAKFVILNIYSDLIEDDSQLI